MKTFCTGLTKEKKNQTKDSLVLKIWRVGAKQEDQDPSLKSKSSDKTIEEITISRIKETDYDYKCDKCNYSC